MGFWDFIENITEKAADKAADGLDRAIRHVADDLDKTTTQSHGISIWGAAPKDQPKQSSDFNWWGEAKPKGQPKKEGQPKERSIWDAWEPIDKPDQDKPGGFSWW